MVFGADADSTSPNATNVTLTRRPNATQAIDASDAAAAGAASAAAVIAAGGSEEEALEAAKQTVKEEGRF